MPEITIFDPSQKHHLYAKYREEWQQNKDFAEMPLWKLRDGVYLDRFGGQQSEADNQYEMRTKMSMLLDLSADLVSMRVFELWQKEPSRTFNDSPYKAFIAEFLRDVDDGGTDMNTFMQRVTEGLYVNGVDVLVDKKATMIEPVSAADENNQPFLTQFDMLDRVDWSIDHAGVYRWVRYSLGVTPILDEDGDEGGDAETFITYTPTEVRTYTMTTEETTVEVANHTMGQVPVVQV